MNIQQPSLNHRRLRHGKNTSKAHPHAAAKALLALALAAGALFASLALCACDREIASSDDGAGMRVAFLASASGVNDGTLCETDYRFLKSYCEKNSIPFRYYIPAKENLVENELVIDAAVADGYNIIISSNYAYASALAKAQETYPEIGFIALDCTEADLGVPLQSNLVVVNFREEISGFFAGYFAVASGYEHLGFLGGMAVPAVLRYQYGFIQGANQAAQDFGIANVAIETVAANQFFGDSDVTAYMDTWYQSLGVEVVFSCGGLVYTSNAEAANKIGGKTIGVDADQSQAFAAYSEGMCLTSALKNTDVALGMLLAEIAAGNFSSFGGKSLTLGLSDPDDPANNYVGLPLETTQWSARFTKDDYAALLKKMYNGEVTVSSEAPARESLLVTVNDHGNIK